jgi:hypothetical protein
MDRAGRADAVPGRPTAQGRCQTLKVALPPKAFGPAQAIRILVASDQAIARDEIRGLIERQADFRVVGHRHGRRDGPLHEGVQGNLPAEVEDDRGGVASQKSEVRSSAAPFRAAILRAMVERSSPFFPPPPVMLFRTEQRVSDIFITFGGLDASLRSRKRVSHSHTRGHYVCCPRYRNYLLVTEEL